MTKNIIVVDAHGKRYGTTYPKRAKGLVKQGRARFLTQNMLCLACPPNQDLEDKDMSEQTIENSVNIENSGTEHHAAEDNVGQDSIKENRYTIEYCLEQIERIARQSEQLKQIIEDQHLMSDESDLVRCGELTNQMLLRFYETVYDDLKPPVKVDVVTQKAQLQEQLIKVMENTLFNGDYSADELTDMFNGAFDAIRHIND